MTSLPLSNLFRTGLFRRQSLLRTVPRNNSRLFLSNKSSQPSRDAGHDGPCEEEEMVHPKPEAEMMSESSAVSVTESLAEQKPKKRGRPKSKPVEVKPTLRGKATLRPGEVLPEVPFGELPPLDMWRKYFNFEKASANRCMVRKPGTAAMLADIFVPEGSKDKIIIEASPGPGQLTRALLNLPKERVKKIFVLEPAKSYLKYLEPLEQLDPRVKVYRGHGREWELYSKLRDDGAFDDVADVDWSEVHPQLQFIMHMSSSVDGEQLLSQFFRCIPDRQWLFRFGRVPLHLILPARMWERMNGVEGTTTRCKLSVIAQATAELSEAVPAQTLQPYTEHFHPEQVYRLSGVYNPPKGSYLESRKLGTPHLAIRALPMKNQHIVRGDLDLWDFVLRKLFVQKATSLQTCLSTNALGPGSSNLIPKLTDPSRGPENVFDLTTKGPRDLNLHEWAMLVEEFKNWPFRPEDLGIEAFFEVKHYNR